MGEVVDLFTRQPIEPPAAEASDFVAEFSENQLPEFMNSVAGMVEAETEEDFRAFMAEVVELANAWPK